MIDFNLVPAVAVLPIDEVCNVGNNGTTGPTPPQPKIGADLPPSPTKIGADLPAWPTKLVHQYLEVGNDYPPLPPK